MKIKAFLISFFLVLTGSLAGAYDLATEISNDNGKGILSSAGYAKMLTFKSLLTLPRRLSLK